MRRVPYSDWAGRAGDFRQVNREPLTPPDFFGARGCALMQQLLSGHYDVALAADEVERLATWKEDRSGVTVLVDRGQTAVWL